MYPPRRPAQAYLISAFWLRLSVVSVLLSLIAKLPSIGWNFDHTNFSGGEANCGLAHAASLLVRSLTLLLRMSAPYINPNQCCWLSLLLLLAVLVAYCWDGWGGLLLHLAAASSSCIRCRSHAAPAPPPPPQLASRRCVRTAHLLLSQRTDALAARRVRGQQELAQQSSQ